MKGGMPTVAVHDLVIHPRDRDLVIGTHGRSIYVIDDIAPLEQLTPEVLAKPGHLFAVRPRQAFKWKAPAAAQEQRVRRANPPYGAIIQYYLKQPPPTACDHHPRRLDGQASGEVWVRRQGRTAPGGVEPPRRRARDRAAR